MKPWALLAAIHFFSACGTQPDTTKPPPAATSLKIVGENAVVEGATLTWVIIAATASGEVPRLEVAGMLGSRPAQELFVDQGQGVGVLSYHAEAGDRLGSPYALTFRAIDPSDPTTPRSAERTIEVINRAPVIERVGAQHTAPGRPLSFALAASDADGVAPQLGCETMPAGAVCDLQAGAFNWTPSPGTEIGPHAVELVARDAIDESLVTRETLFITVSDHAPSLDLLPDQRVTEGELLTLPVAGQRADGGAAELSVMLFEAELMSDLVAHGAPHSFSRASPATIRDDEGKLVYVPADTPRFFAGGRGLLVEGRRVNRVPMSVALGAVPWSASFAGEAIDDYGVAPDGTQSSSLVQGNASPYAARIVPVSLVADGHYETPGGMFTLKLHLKAATSALSRIGLYNDTRAAWETFVDIAWTDGVPAVGGSVNAEHVELASMGYADWWVLSFRFTPDAATTETDATYVHVEPDRQGQGGAIEAWGCQLESGHLSTSYIHNTSGAPLAREADLLSYEIAGYALGFPANNVMVECDYTPQWESRQVRGWHPRFWGSRVDDQTYFLARTSRSSPNFVATRTDRGDALQEDVTLGPSFAKGDLVHVVVRATSSAGLEILPDYISDGVLYPQYRQRQAWGATLMVGNLVDHAVSNMAATETDGPLNAPLRHLRVFLLDSAEPNASGASFVDGVFSWRPGPGAHRDSPYRVTFRATDPTDPRVYVQQSVLIEVAPPSP